MWVLSPKIVLNLPKSKYLPLKKVTWGYWCRTTLEQTFFSTYFSARVDLSIYSPFKAAKKTYLFNSADNKHDQTPL